MNDGHFKLGLFVTLSVVLLAGFLLALGILDRFRPHIMAETYFDTSIQQLQSGADVKYRGVKVGSVGAIEIAAAKYEEAAAGDDRRVGGLIRVELALDPSRLSRIGTPVTPAFIDKAADDGLRAQLAMSGIGGPTFIEIDYVNTTIFPKPDYPWASDYVVLPSVPSTVGTIVDSLAAMLREMKRGDLVGHLVKLSTRLDQFLNEFDGIEDTDLYRESTGALAELRAASAEARALLADPRLDTLLDDAGATMTEARSFLEAEDGKLEALIADLTTMSQSLDRAAGSLDTLATNVNTSDLIGDLEGLATELGPAGRDLSDLANRLDRLVEGNETQISDTIRSLRNAVEGLQALLEELKANPSRLLSKPPPRTTPGARP